MPLRWYKGFSYKGNVQQLVEQISRHVQQYNLSEFVPLVRVEKGTKGKTFYFFIAIESSELGEVPPVLQSTLLQLPFFKYGIKGSPCFAYEDIKSMVGAAHDVYNYTNPIPYKPVQEITYDNPFDLIASPAINQLSPDDEVFAQRFEKLLYWVSAVGCGTWESFKKACDALKLEEPKRILRRLRLLGHIEASLDGSRWSTAPTALVQIKSQSKSQEFIVCGQRSLNLIRKLEQNGNIELSNQPRGAAPPCIHLQLDKPSILFHIVEKTNGEFPIANAGEVSSQLANILPDIAIWKKSLRCLQGIVPSLYEWKRFDGNNFVSCIFSKETGMYQMWMPNESDYSRYTLFYEQESEHWLQGDWYGLRFLAVQHNGQECVVHYDADRSCLAIPRCQRWPEIYERALVLASGKLPMYQESWLLYENISLDMMRRLTNKLNVNYEEAL